MEYNFSFTDKCWLKGNCPREKSEGCKATCQNYIELHYLMNTSNIPLKLRGINKLNPQNEDYKTFCNLNEIKQDINNFVKEGEFLYIWGENTGNSKTTWAVKLMQAYIGNIHLGNRLQDRCWFEFVPTLLKKLKNFENQEEKQEAEKRIKESDLVIFDDVGSVKSTDYDDSNIISLLDYRYSNAKSCIFTGNINPENLIKTFDMRVVDRILSGYSIELKGISERGKGCEYVSSSNTINKQDTRRKKS